MLDFCGKHGIAADIELIRAEDINTAMERLAKSDVRYRFVIDVGNSLANLWASSQTIWPVELSNYSFIHHGIQVFEQW